MNKAQKTKTIFKQSWKSLQAQAKRLLHPRKYETQPTGNKIRATQHAERSHPLHGGRHS